MWNHQETTRMGKGMACAASKGSGVRKTKGCLLGGSQTYSGGSFSPALTPRSIPDWAFLQPCLLDGPWTYAAISSSAPSPGWTVGLCCSLISSFASGPISCYSWVASGFINFPLFESIDGPFNQDPDLHAMLRECTRSMMALPVLGHPWFLPRLRDHVHLYLLSSLHVKGGVRTVCERKYVWNQFKYCVQL